MRLAFFLAGLMAAAQSGWAQSADAWTLESRGQAAEAQALLERAANAVPANPAAARAYAEFLERYQDPAARQAYSRLAQLLDSSRAPAAERAAGTTIVSPSSTWLRETATRPAAIWPRSPPWAAPDSPLRRVWPTIPIQSSSRFPDP